MDSYQKEIADYGKVYGSGLGYGISGFGGSLGYGKGGGTSGGIVYYCGRGNGYGQGHGCGAGDYSDGYGHGNGCDIATLPFMLPEVTMENAHG